MEFTSANFPESLDSLNQHLASRSYITHHKYNLHDQQVSLCVLYKYYNWQHNIMKMCKLVCHDCSFLGPTHSVYCAGLKTLKDIAVPSWTHLCVIVGNVGNKSQWLKRIVWNSVHSIYHVNLALEIANIDSKAASYSLVL